MKDDAALIYAQASSAAADKWETEERGSYDIGTMHEEYRERLYSEKAFALISDRADRKRE